METYEHPMGGATTHPSDTMVLSGPCVIVGRYIHVPEHWPMYAIWEPFRASSLEPSTNFELVSHHILDYHPISNCKSVHTDQT